MQNRAIEISPIVKNRKITAPPTAKPSTSSKSGASSKTASSAAKPQRTPLQTKPTPKSPTNEKQIGSRISSSKPTSPSVRTLSPGSSKQTSSQKVADKPSNQPKSASSKLPEPVKEKSRPPSSKSVSSKSSSKKSLSSAKLGAQWNPTTPPRLDVSTEDVKQLADKFRQVTSSVLQVATSKRAFGKKSLEALLNLELTNHLGEALNEPSFSQGFVKATRGLIEEIVRLAEAGKLNPKLLNEEERKKKSYVRANSATTVCYRDRYFKELVMNVLQSMTSSELEDEVTSKVEHSDESRERIQTIRDMVRAEAGIEPDNFRELEQRLNELKRSLSRNKLEMEKAALEVDRIISKHMVDQEQTASSLKIPAPARDVLKACYKRLESGSDVGDKGACKSGKGCCGKNSCSENSTEGGTEKYKKSLEIVGDTEHFERGNSDEIKNIRPQLKNLVHEELLKVKKKKEELLNQDRDRHRERNSRLADTPKSSFESVEFKSAASNLSGDEDEVSNISEEETQHFLKKLKAEIEEKKLKDEDVSRCGPQGVFVRILERIDEHEDENKNYSETVVKPDSSKTSSREHIDNSLDKDPGDKSLINQVKSTCFFQMPSDFKDILADLKEAFQTFKSVSDVFSAYEVSEDQNEEKFVKGGTNTDGDLNLWDFSVEEVADVLVNISDRINKLSDYVQELDSIETPDQIKQAFLMLSKLEKNLNSSKPTNSDTSEVFEETPYLVEKYGKVFSFLSDILNKASKDLKSELISVLNPPESLIDTLHSLSSVAYFRDCFPSIKVNIGRKAKTTKSVEVVKPYNMNEVKSSREILNFDNIANMPLKDINSGHRRRIHSHMRDKKRPEDLKNNISKFEDFMGLPTSVITIQNVSDMFLFLSTVLNDVPERIKSEKVLDLDPPPSLLKALDILYCDDDGDSVTDLEKKKSFASLTLQNVSDLFLTLSKVFDDIPERLKGSTVEELDPPQSLVRAIKLLTSLSDYCITKRSSQELRSDYEQFFDAVASVASVS